MTTQKVLEERLRASREAEQQLSTLNLILSATGEFVYLFDRQGRYRFASESAANLLGLAQQDFAGKTWQELGLPAELMEPFVAQFQKVLATGQPLVDEILFPIAGELRWFEYVTQQIVDGEGAVESVVVVARDITERRQTADTLHQWASIVESSGEAILSKTLDGVITSWNSSAEKLYGYCAEEVIGRPILFLFPPDLHQQFWEIMAHIKAGEIVRDLETIRRRKDGTPIHVSVTISPIPDHKGRIVGASAIAHEITEYKRLVKELLDVNRSLEEANQARSQFLATMSHELRTPLASIIGFSEMLLEDVPAVGMDQAQRDNLQRILKNGHHLLKLVNDVLDLEKIERHRMEIFMRSVEVKDLVTTVVEQTQAIAAVQRTTLKTEVEEGIGSIETDPLRLQQVLLNLVSNALKFTRQGEVTISARRVPGSEQQVESIALAVKDTGIGIPLDKQEKIFEAFYQVDGSYTRQVGGTGLGLSIVSQFTRLLGGKVEVSSAPGQGSTFTVTLPMKAALLPVEQDMPRLHPARKDRDDASTLSPADSTHRAGQEGEKQAVVKGGKGQSNVVLVVDDNPDAIIIVKAALEATSFTVVGVQDPTQVLNMVHSYHPCVITLDVMMPELNGWQMLHRLKDDPATASIPVVIISVLAEQKVGYVLGADAYLLKPFNVMELVNTVQRIASPQRGSTPLPVAVSQAFAPGAAQMGEAE